MYLRPELQKLLSEIAKLPAAAHILVFGSVGRMESKPVDLDVALHVPDCESWIYAYTTHERTIRTLRGLAHRYYGDLDPFVITEKDMMTRNADASGWIRAKNAKAIKANILKDGKPILAFLPMIQDVLEPDQDDQDTSPSSSPTP